MTHKSHFARDGYTWLWIGDDDALLRATSGEVERWRLWREGDSGEGAMRSSNRVWTFVGRETFMSLPLEGRLDLGTGQIVELINAPNWTRKGYTHGVIESVYSIMGGVRYRVRLTERELVGLKPRQVKVWEA